LRKLTGALGLLVPAIGLVANAFKVLFALVTLSPFAIVGAGLIALAVAIYANWGNIVAFFATVWEGIKTGATDVGAWIVQKFSDAAAGIVGVFSGIGDALSAAWEAIKTGAGAAWQWVQDKAREALDAIKQFFSVDGFSAFWEGLKKAARIHGKPSSKALPTSARPSPKTFTDALATHQEGWTNFVGTIAMPSRL
jgi:phage-related protein